MVTRSRYRSFTAKEKLRVIYEAENIANCVAGRKYDVNESCICDWCKKTKCDLQKRIVIVEHFSGQKARHLELQKRLCDYVDDKRQ